MVLLSAVQRGEEEVGQADHLAIGVGTRRASAVWLRICSTRPTRRSSSRYSRIRRIRKQLISMARSSAAICPRWKNNCWPLANGLTGTLNQVAGDVSTLLSGVCNRTNNTLPIGGGGGGGGGGSFGGGGGGAVTPYFTPFTWNIPTSPTVTRRFVSRSTRTPCSRETHSRGR